MKRKIFITSITVVLLALMVTSCGRDAAETPSSPPRAAIVNQLYLLEPNPLFIEKAVDMLVSETFCGSGGYGWGFHREITIPSEDRKNIVDNSEYYYSLLAYSLLAEESDHVNYEAIISGISIRYDYGL